MLSTPRSRLAAALLRWGNEHAQAAPEAHRTNLRRIRFLGVTIGVLNLLHIVVLAAYDVDGDLPARALWRNGLLAAHGVMGAFMLLFARIAHCAIHRPRCAALATHLPLMAGLVGLSMASVIGVIDQWITPNITPIVTSTLAIAAILLMPPRRAAVIYLANYAIFACLVQLTQQDSAILLSNRIAALGSTLIGWGLAVVQWRNFATISAQQQALAEAHDELGRRHEVLERLARTDELTGLHNRPAAIRSIERRLAEADAAGQDVALLVLDLDFFKEVNDRHGHPAGDATLRHVARVLAEGVGPAGVVGRLGGEEFVIFVQDVSPAQAAELADSLRARVAAHDVRWEGHAIPLTISIGTAIGPAGTRRTFPRLYGLADRGLYEAKTSGRNQCRSGTLA